MTVTPWSAAPAPTRRLSERWRVGGSLRELTALAPLLAAALAARVVGMTDVEPSILADEADHLSTIYRILAGRGPGPFDLSWDGNPAFSLYPAVPFVALLEPDQVALRLSVACGSVLMLGAFYLLARRWCSPLAAWVATGLLAFSEWALFFSRNGEVNIFVALYALVAAWWLQHAVDGGGRRAWAATGVWAGLGWYGFLAGVLILPSLLAPLAYWFLRRRDDRRRLLRGGGILVAAFALTVLPRVPALVQHRDDVQRYVEGRSVMRNTPAAAWPDVLAGQTVLALRAFLILDPSLVGNPRYLAPGRSVLDGINGTLYVAGLALAACGRGGSPLWWSLLVVPLGTTQLLTINTPDTARAIAALPACFLFVALAVDGLLRSVPLRPLARAAVIVAVPAVGWANWQAYSGWMTSAAAVRAREPAIDYVELAEWRAEQQRLAATADRGLTVSQWRAEHPRPTPAPAPAPTVRTARQREARSITPLFALAIGQGGTPRGVAIASDGDVLVAEASGRVSRLDPAGPSLVPIGGTAATGGLAATGGAGAAEGGRVWDLATGPDGSAYLADSERDRIVKVDGLGQEVATLGAGWGLYRPRGLTVAADGRLYVADTGGDRIIVASPDGSSVRILGPGPGGAALREPTDVAVGDGRVFVALPEAGRLEVLDESGRRVGGWSIARGNTIESTRLALTDNGEIIVSEPSARRVRIFDQEGRQVGQVDAGLVGPFGVASAGDRLYVTDSAAGRVLGYLLGRPSEVPRP